MKVILRGVAVALAVVGFASDGTGQSLPEGVTTAMVDEGKQIYNGAGLCMACHGPDGKGLVGPDLTDEEWFTGEGEYAQIIEQVRDGVTAEQAKNSMGAIMPPRGGGQITDEQVRAVAAYVWTLSNGGGDRQRDDR